MQIVVVTLGVAGATMVALADDQDGSFLRDSHGDWQAKGIAGQEVVVHLRNGHLHSGRTIAAAIDPDATQDQLWLRWENSAAVIRQRIRWSNVTHFELLEGPVSADELRHRLPLSVETRRVAPENISRPAPVVMTVLPRQPISEDAVATAPRMVRSLAIDARAANWDADPAVDGVRLTIYPLDAQGDVVAVRGTVTAELVGDIRSLRKPQPKNRFPHLSRLGWWSRAVQPNSFDAGGAELELPFQSYNPEFDATVRSRTLLIVRLTVPGQGVYHASLADVWVRPFSTLRNRIETSTGRRYLPQEMRGR